MYRAMVNNLPFPASILTLPSLSSITLRTTWTEPFASVTCRKSYEPPSSTYQSIPSTCAVLNSNENDAFWGHPFQTGNRTYEESLPERVKALVIRGARKKARTVTTISTLNRDGSIIERKQYPWVLWSRNISKRWKVCFLHIRSVMAAPLRLGAVQ